MARQSTKESMFAAAAAANRPKRIPFTATTRRAVENAAEAAALMAKDQRTVSAAPSAEHLALTFVAGEAAAGVHKYVRSYTVGRALHWPPEVQRQRDAEALDQAIMYADALLDTLQRIVMP